MIGPFPALLIGLGLGLAIPSGVLLVLLP